MHFFNSTEFKAPIRYIPNPADTVNELLFDLLTRQLSQLGLREVILQEGDCRQLLENLNLQAAADCPHKEEDFPNNSGRQLFYKPIVMLNSTVIWR